MLDISLGKRNLFVCWFSEGMTGNRAKALDIISNSCNVNLHLITKDNLYDYENDEIKIHKGFEFLTDCHKSDYVRAYLMYFYGGGYSDIKANSFDWNPYFDELFISDYDAIGYAEKNFGDIVMFWNNDPAIKKIVADRYSDFAGNGHFIFKPRTRFAHDWINNVHKLMDENYNKLKSSPGVHPYMIKGGVHTSYHGEIPPELKDHGYPFEWADVGGKIRHGLEYAYGLNVFKKGMPFTNMKNYR